MYNYFMLIGIVEGIIDAKVCYIELRVDRMFGDGSDHFRIRLLEPLNNLAKEINLFEKITIKGRILANTNGNLELIGERIIFFRDSK